MSNLRLVYRICRNARRVTRSALALVWVVLLVGVFLFSVSPALAVAGPADIHSSEGTRYYLQAQDISLTSRQVGAFQRSGTLAQEIADRAHLLVRILPYGEVYQGVIERTDLSTLQDASQTVGEKTYRVTFTVNRTVPGEGEIVVAVTVKQSQPIMVDSTAPGTLLFGLFKAPLPPVLDPKTQSGEDETTAGLPTEVAALPTANSSVDASSTPDLSSAVTVPASVSEVDSDTDGVAGTTGHDTDTAGRSWVTRLLSAINERGAQGWLAFGIETMTILGVAPAFAASVNGDLRVLRWHKRKKEQLKAGHSHV